MAIKRRKKNQAPQKINLVPIMDATFIFIFFLLMSVSFTKVNEVGTELPITSDQEPPKDKKPLALTLNVTDDAISVETGLPSVVRTRIKKGADGFYNLTELHEYLVRLKKETPWERSVVLNPLINLNYEEIIRIMDTIRILEKTDDTIYNKNKDGITEKVKMLFDQIMFGNTVT